MLMIYKSRFTHKGKHFEVGVSETRTGFEVRVYENGKPVNGYVYTLDSTSLGVFKWDPESEVCNRLVEIAKSDVESGIWERVLAARVKK